MEHEPGDAYVHRIAQFIRNNERNLAEGGFGHRRRKQRPQEVSSVFNPLTWLGLDGQPKPIIKPVVFSVDLYHLFYLLMRIEALGVDVGTLDVKLDNPARPTSYIDFTRPSDKSDTLSLSSIRSSLSAVSNLSLGSGWWSRTTPPSIDLQLKYIYSSFTKLPALALHAPTPKLIAELVDEPPYDSAIPLDSFKNLQCLACTDVDPRILLGWDRVAESVRSLTIKRGGLQDVTDVFINLVVDDQARREGHAMSTRQKRITRGSSCRSSFYGTRLPDTVPEDSEEAVSSTDDRPESSAKLSSLKWAGLKHLCLAENSLAVFPMEPLPYLTSLSHLDLSSNLLVSIPPGLSALHNLISLNLSDNMIDSVLGIYQRLGQILYLNISHNRLESICGLERLPALERVDLRNNLIEESAEVGRLATLPNISEVLVEGNPLIEVEENHRIKCFDFFWKEGKIIMLDGSLPSFYEKQFLTEPVAEQMKSSRSIQPPQSPPIVAVGATPVDDPLQRAFSPIPPSPQSTATSPGLGPSAVHRGQKKRSKRIVDLNGVGDDEGGGANSREIGSKNAVEITSQSIEHASSSLHPDPKPEPMTMTPVVVHPPRISRHGRHRSEASAAVDFPNIMTASATTGSIRAARIKGAARRARAFPSTYEPPMELNGENGKDQQKEADDFRAKIEALRADMGDGWLKVLNQSPLGSAGVKSW